MAGIHRDDQATITWPSAVNSWIHAMPVHHFPLIQPALHQIVSCKAPTHQLPCGLLSIIPPPSVTRRTVYAVLAAHRLPQVGEVITSSVISMTVTVVPKGSEHLGNLTDCRRLLPPAVASVSPRQLILRAMFCGPAPPTRVGNQDRCWAIRPSICHALLFNSCTSA